MSHNPAAATGAPGDDRLAAVFTGFPDPKREYLIPVLQAAQEAEGYLSHASIVRIADYLKLPASKVYGVATFYNQFRFQGQGRFHVQVCRGTACHVRGSLDVLKATQRTLKVEPGQTTKDGLFSLEVVACMGACGLAPVMVVGKDIHGRVTPERVAEIIKNYN